MVWIAKINKRNAALPPRDLTPIVADYYCESLHVRIMDEARKNAGYNAHQWVHLDDAVQRGTISKLEAIDSLILGYVPAHLALRPSLYVNTF